MSFYSLCSFESHSDTIYDKPNFVFLLTDDQDLEFDSVKWMPNLQKLVISNGISFDNAFVATPICCASRTETIAGRYYQNVGAPHGTCMQVNAQEMVFNDSNTLFQSFNNAGYVTGMFGKLTNDMTHYFCELKPPLTNGLDRIHAPCLYNDFYGTLYFDKFMNGSVILKNLSQSSPKAYEGSQTGNSSLDWIKNDLQYDPRPFIAWIGPHTPHFPAVPPYWYGQALNSSVKAPRTPNWNQHFSKYAFFC